MMAGRHRIGRSASFGAHRDTSIGGKRQREKRGDEGDRGRRATPRHGLTISCGQPQHSEDFVNSSSGYSRTRRSLKALAMTETELNVIAAPAQIGLMSVPVNGYRMPAAIG